MKRNNFTLAIRVTDMENAGEINGWIFHWKYSNTKHFHGIRPSRHEEAPSGDRHAG